MYANSLCYSSETSIQPATMGVGGVDPFLVCPGCGENFEAKGDRQPMSLRCGHTFCSGIIIVVISIIAFVK